MFWWIIVALEIVGIAVLVLIGIFGLIYAIIDFFLD